MDANILVIEDDLVNQKLHEKVIETMGMRVTLAGDGAEGVKLAAKHNFDLVISDVMMPNMDGFEVCKALRENPNTAQIPILLLTSLDNLESKLKGFEAGADDYLAKPYDPEELIARVSVLLRRAVQVAPLQELDRAGKIISVFSLRGGIGVSTVAANLTAGLTQLWGRESVLVDLAFTAGQAALMFNLPLRNTWADIAKMPNEDIDQEVLGAILRSHSSGVRVLSAPREVVEGEIIDADKVQRVIELLRQSYDYVVLDLPHNFAETSLAGLDNADEILLVLAPELASIRATAMALEAFDILGYYQDSIHLILNWVFERQGLSKTNIEAGLHRKINAIIPFASEQFIRAINFGSPPVIEEPESPLGAIFEDLAFWVSKDEHKKQRPKKPTEAWKRLAARVRKQRRGK